MSIRSLILLVVACLVCSSRAEDSLQDFLNTFPSVNKSDVASLESKLFQISGLPSYAACAPISAAPDTDDVKNLRPGNIRVIAALGDSITSGSSAKDTNILSLKQYRGLAYSVGGDKGVVTAVSLLQQFTPAGFPIGASLGTGERTIAGNGFNGGVNGARHIDMPEQATWLVNRIRANLTASNFTNYWKVVTIWIGSNNLCDYCNDQTANGAAAFELNVDKALAYLHANLPRTFVNLVVNLDVTQIYNFKTGTCSLLHSYECPCGASSSNATRQTVLQVTRDYTKRLYALEAKYAALNSKTFGVVVQPFLDQAVIPDRAWLSAADCFHPSAIAHEAMAIGLWNNMITPKALKSNKLVPGQQPVCPTDNTLLYTN